MKGFETREKRNNEDNPAPKKCPSDLTKEVLYKTERENRIWEETEGLK